MAFMLIDDGVSSVVIRFVEQKKDGSFQYRRRIPQALRHRYAGRSFFVRSLQRDISKIRELAYKLTNELNRQWSDWLGLQPAEIISVSSIDYELEGKGKAAYPDHSDDRQRDNSFLLSQAHDLYLAHHKNGSKPSFKEDCERVIESATALLGDLRIDAYSRSDAERLRDHWLQQMATRTARRRLITIVAIINKARKEKQLQILNPFEGLGIVGEGEDGIKRTPFDHHELKIIAAACRSLDDDIRHIIAFQMDTGCRVAEIVGLRVEDVILDHPIPHVRIRPWGKIRTLKTAASERDIPLVGEARWAAERALEARRKAKGASPWLFPRYASDVEIKATHASNALNKWLRSLEGVSRDKTTHCFRHAMRDRLRAAQVPHDVQEAIGGWGTRTIGQGYGNGYPLQVLAEHLVKLRL